MKPRARTILRRLGKCGSELVLGSTVVGQEVIKDGRVVSQGALKGVTANTSRRGLTALQLSPGTLVS